MFPGHLFGIQVTMYVSIPQESGPAKGSFSEQEGYYCLFSLQKEKSVFAAMAQLVKCYTSWLTPQLSRMIFRSSIGTFRYETLPSWTGIICNQRKKDCSKHHKSLSWDASCRLCCLWNAPFQSNILNLVSFVPLLLFELFSWLLMWWKIN